MKLIYEKTGQEVKVGDKVETFRGETVEVSFFRPPHKPSSEGHVSVKRDGGTREFYVSVIGAEWIDRTDR